MPEKPKQDEKDERLAIPLDPEEALRALLQVEPHLEPTTGDVSKPRPRRQG